jgi:murein DD-endopeptidase MepM/ murein hydrolase activator NlpD
MMTAKTNRLIAIAFATTALAGAAWSSSTAAASLEASAPARFDATAHLMQSDQPAPPSESLPERASPPVNRPPSAAQPADIDGAPQPAPDTAPMPTASSPQPTPPAYQPAPVVAAAPPPPKPAPAYKVSVDGKVESTPGASFTLVVEKGDTVKVIAEHLNTPVEDIIKLNKLKKPYELEVGRKLKIPTAKVYVVEAGDTLYSIGRRFTVKPQVLGDVNDMDVGAHLHPGQHIALPIEHKDTGPVRTLVAAEPPARQPNPYRRPYAVIQPGTTTGAEGGDPGVMAEPGHPPVRAGGYIRNTPPPPSINGAPVVESTPAPTDAQVASAGRGRFAWPIRGAVLWGFGPKAGGQKNDGVDISGSMGEPVMAAAAGEVVYAGNQVPGFGNLVLIKHDGGWVTAYAHLSRTEVKIKEEVAQGQEIGQVGESGGVDQPQLHFEIRYAPSARDKARPIDPSLVLAPR